MIRSSRNRGGVDDKLLSTVGGVDFRYRTTPIPVNVRCQQNPADKSSGTTCRRGVDRGSFEGVDTPFLGNFRMRKFRWRGSVVEQRLGVHLNPMGVSGFTHTDSKCTRLPQIVILSNRQSRSEGGTMNCFTEPVPQVQV